MLTRTSAAILGAISLCACSSSNDTEPNNPGNAGAAGQAGWAGAAGSAGSAGSSGAAGAAGSAGSTTDECPAPGATQCEGLLLQVCEPSAQGLAWSEPAPCESPNHRCRDTTCTPPTAEQLSQLASIDELVDAMVKRSAWHQPLDAATLGAIGYDTLLAGEGDDLTYYGALRRVHAAVPQGHQSLYPATGCGTESIPASTSSRFGVCGRPRGDGIVVTVARDGNLLGLSPGDVVESLEGMAGSELFDAVSLRILCTASSPTQAHVRGNAATSFFAAVREGETLRVRSIDGSVRDVVVPAQDDGTLTDCQDPLGRDIAFDAQSYVRPDGIAVIRLPRFFPLEPPDYDPNDPASVQALIDYMMDQVVAAFEPVKDAPMLIWDARSNFGGITPVGLAIAGGMPSAQPVSLSYCQYRLPDTSPPAFSGYKYAEYEVETGGPFAYAGKVAVLIDELDYSAADYFPLAVQLATDALLVGTPTAGAYGGSGQFESLSASPAAYFTIDVNKCSLAATDEPLEGSSVQPDMLVEYEPEDLANGVDTVMEAAAEALKSM